MAENKTKPTTASVADHLAAIEDPARRRDCQTLDKLMRKVTKKKPVMWGPSIVGYGQFHYRYASGHEGDTCLVGFASRKSDLSVYLLVGSARQQQLLARLGKHKMAKACLYIRRLEDVDLGVLELLIADAVTEIGRHFGAESAKAERAATRRTAGKPATSKSATTKSATTKPATGKAPTTRKRSTT